MNGRALRAFIGHTEVGTLQDVGGLWSFQYSADWLDKPRNFTTLPGVPVSRSERLPVDTFSVATSR